MIANDEPERLKLTKLENLSKQKANSWRDYG